MSIEVDPLISVRCDSCAKLKSETEVRNYCTACDATSKPVRGEEIRKWADRKCLLGHITTEQRAFLEEVAHDIDLEGAAGKKRAA